MKNFSLLFINLQYWVVHEPLNKPTPTTFFFSKFFFPFFFTRLFMKCILMIVHQHYYAIVHEHSYWVVHEQQKNPLHQRFRWWSGFFLPFMNGLFMAHNKNYLCTDIANYAIFYLGNVFFYYLTFPITGLDRFWRKNFQIFLGGTPRSGPLKI